MKHEAIRELKDISKLPDQVREEQLDAWIDRWVVPVEFTQDVVDSKYLTSEYNDVIKTRLAQNMAEDLAETCVGYVTKKKSITGTMIAIRRKSK